MKIGKIKKITGVSNRSIRYYEEKGLISASRQENNYREYDEKVIESIHAIQLYLKLGLTTDQIREIIFCKYPEQQEKELFCEKLLQMYEAKMSEVSKQIESLTEVKSSLAEKICQMKDKREMQVSE